MLDYIGLVRWKGTVLYLILINVKNKINAFFCSDLTMAAVSHWLLVTESYMLSQITSYCESGDKLCCLSKIAALDPYYRIKCTRGDSCSRFKHSLYDKYRLA